MTRFLIAGIVLLVALLVLGRLQRTRPPQAGPTTVAVLTPAPAPDSLQRVSAVVTAETSGTPVIDLLARLESRRRLTAAAAYTYFDSLFVETDSVLRRWADADQALSVAVLTPPPNQPGADLPDLVRSALAVWQGAGLGVRFSLVGDSSGAQIVVESVAQLAGIRAGQTNLGWTPDGAIHSAVISLARTDSSGRAIPAQGALAIAVHEVGHALGLGHSPDPGDVMYQMARSTVLSQRDLATVRLLYELPLGSAREPRLP